MKKAIVGTVVRITFDKLEPVELDMGPAGPVSAENRITKSLAAIARCRQGGADILAHPHRIVGFLQQGGHYGTWQTRDVRGHC